LTTFSDLGLAEVILRAVAEEGYTNPTPIQANVIPAIIEGHDVLGIAQTGTGKTAAFVLPILNALMANKERPAERSCKALILAPTRELANQIGQCVRDYGRFMRPSVAIIVGGAAQGPQIRALSRGVDIVVATPGRLLDHLGTGAVKLFGTHVVVLDEADQMLDMGFIPAIRRIMGLLPVKRQTILLSATMPPAIRGLANDFLRQPKEVSVAPSSRPIDKIDQRVMLMEAGAKRDALVNVLSDADVTRAIVFTRTKRGADRVEAHLDSIGLSSGAIHGNKSQSQRERALAAFRDGRIKVLVATDIAARGIDVDGVTHVINYELPNIPESYVHRIGRTARAGASGVAISFCDSSERAFLRDIEKLIGRAIDASGDFGRDGRHTRGERPAGAAAKRPARPAHKPGGSSNGGYNGERSNGGHAQKPAGQKAAYVQSDRPARTGDHSARPAAAKTADGSSPQRRPQKPGQHHAGAKPSSFGGARRSNTRAA